MKMMRIIILMAALMGAGVWAEEAPNETPNDHAAETQDNDEQSEQTRNLDRFRMRCRNLDSKMKEYDKQFEAMEAPPRSLVSLYKRVSGMLAERLQNVEQLIEKCQASQSKRAELLSSDYVFSIVPDDQRMKYIEDGKALIKRAVRGLHGRTEGQQVEGLNLMMKAHEAYQGVAGYVELEAMANEVISKLSRKWSRAKERLTKTREKLVPAAAEKSRELDQRAYEKQMQSIEGANQSKQIIAPMQNNLLMLEKACASLSSCSDTLKGQQGNEQGQTEQLLVKCWEKLDLARSKMMGGELDEAESILRDGEEFAAVRSLRPEFLGQVERSKLSEQIQAMLTELRGRLRALSKLDSSINRDMNSIERSLHTLEQQQERLDSEFEDFRRAQEDSKEDAKGDVADQPTSDTDESDPQQDEEESLQSEEEQNSEGGSKEK